MIRKVFLHILLSGLLFCVFGCNTQTYEVQDVTKETKIILKKKKSQGFVHFIKISATGKIDGAAELVLGENASGENISGEVDYQHSGDWYSDTCVIYYKPSSVKGGKLIFNYKFKDL
jgi:hypothetical protein